ncbi:hypothetical protein Aaci_2028 [Calderihabitans maritimus]|uniref:Uncharacterized protein n=1 Tax=Calderihabitans maritimus TaxID=1246530 RepID=A0A1Z5HTL0_9FIRM|nr:hypothetical protein Aaci_2028 [Calderihabitans maritimus]
MRCPNCLGRNVRRLKGNRYFCLECFVEIEVRPDQLRVYSINSGGETLCQGVFLRKGQNVY